MPKKTPKPKRTEKLALPWEGLPPKQRAFLAAIAHHPNKSRAAVASGFQREYHHRLYKTDPRYAAAFDQAWALGCETLEEEAADRARFGTKDVVMYQGQPCFWKYRKVTDKKTKEVTVVPVGPPITRTVLSDGLMQFLLRGAMPDKYRERIAPPGGQGDKPAVRWRGTMEDLLELYRKLTSKSVAA